MEEGLYDPVLQRVVAHHDHPAPRRQISVDIQERLADLGKLVVDGDPNRLERAGRGMGPPALPWDHLLHRSRQVGRRTERSTAPTPVDHAGDLAGGGLLSELPLNALDLSNRNPPEQVSRTLARSGVHAHVQYPFTAEAESPVRRVQLIRGDSEIE